MIKHPALFFLAVICALPTPIAAQTASSTVTFYNPYYAVAAAANLSNTVNIFGVSTYRAVPGQAMSIFGRGFDKNSNTVQIGGELIKNLPSVGDDTLISFVVPQALTTGSYSILVFNQYGLGSSGALALRIDASAGAAGVSASGGGSAGISPAKPAAGVPSLSAVAPKSSNFLTQVIVLTGNNFSANNTILTNLGNIYNVASGDGKTLIFTVGTLPYYSQTLEKYKGRSGSLLIGVNNEYGTAKERLAHTLTFPASGIVSDASPTNTADILRSTADYQRLIASTTYGLYPSFSAGTSTESALQTLFDIISAYSGLSKTTASSSVSTNSPAAAVENAMPKPVVNPYIANINPYIIGPLINPPSNNTANSATEVNAAGSAGQSSLLSLNASPAVMGDYFGGAIVKIVRCASDDTVLVYIKDYAHLYKIYGLTYDPQKSKVTRADAGIKGGIGGGSLVFGKLIAGRRECIAAAGQPQSLIGTSVGTIDSIQKMNSQ